MQKYHAERRLAAAANPGGASPGQSWRQRLPVWATLKLAKLLRQLHDGMRDAWLAGLCCSPPKGGYSSITWQGCLSQDDNVKGEVDEIQAACSQWLDELRGVAQAAPTEQKKEGGQSPGVHGGSALSSTTISKEVEDQYETIREEMRCLTREIRGAYVSIAPLQYSAPQIQSFVEASALLKKCQNADGTHRICYVYSVNLSWSPKRPTANQTDKRAYMPIALWKDHYY